VCCSKPIVECSEFCSLGILFKYVHNFIFCTSETEGRECMVQSLKCTFNARRMIVVAFLRNEADCLCNTPTFSYSCQNSLPTILVYLNYGRSMHLSIRIRCAFQIFFGQKLTPKSKAPVDVWSFCNNWCSRFKDDTTTMTRLGQKCRENKIKYESPTCSQVDC